jgi:hypothetical protein
LTAYHKERDTLDRNVDEEKAQSAEVVDDVQHSPLHVVNLDLLVLVGSALRNQSLRGNHALTLVKEPAFGRAPGHQERCSKTDNNCEKTLKEENVAPFVNAHRSNTPLGNARKSIQM